MKKTLFSIGLVVASAFYVLFSSQGSLPVVAPPAPVTAGNNSQSLALTPSNNPTSSGGSPTPVPVATTTTPPPATTPTPVTTPAPTPAPKPAGLYADGAYTGSVADAYYGNIQVKAIVSGGKITDVQFLQYPDTHSTSVRVNTRAMPYLKQEAIQAQSANVNIVSGATETSMAFQQSLASALAQAKN